MGYRTIIRLPGRPMETVQLYVLLIIFVGNDLDVPILILISWQEYL